MSDIEYDDSLTCDEADGYTDDIAVPDERSGDEAEWPVMAWCGAEIFGEQAVNEHLRECPECKAAITQMNEDGPPGYSGGLAELGYEGDG